MGWENNWICNLLQSKLWINTDSRCICRSGQCIAFTVMKLISLLLRFLIITVFVCANWICQRWKSRKRFKETKVWCVPTLGSWSFILIYARLNSFSKLLFLYVIQIDSVVARSYWFKDSWTSRAYSPFAPYEYFGKKERKSSVFRFCKHYTRHPWWQKKS